MRNFKLRKGQSVFGANAVAADLLSAHHRLDELATILALGLVRLRARQSSRLSAASENSFVDFAANQSGRAVDTFATENAWK
jgi:hypothetical protein